MPLLHSVRQPAAATHWFASAPALALLREEQRQLAPELSQNHGLGLLVRPHPAAPADCAQNRLQALFRVFVEGRQLNGDFRADSHSLPLVEESLQTIYLLHALEVVPDPAALLAEAARTLAPEGRLLAITLNPASPWAGRWVGRGPRPITATQTKRWLRAAGLEIVRQRTLGPCWPALRANRDPRKPAALGLVAPLRASCLLIVRKRKPGLTLLPVSRRRVALAIRPYPG